MAKQLFIGILIFFSIVCRGQHPALKEIFKDKFLIGAALNKNQITGKDTAGVRVVKQHFNSIVAENCMKMEGLQPLEGEFDFSVADKLVEFGEKNNLFIIGHNLVWHSQCPGWFFKDREGNEVSKEVLIERMRKHITTVVSHYKGRVKGWDVVNEAILDDGSLRNSKFLQIVGEDYLRLAFEFARSADPDAELYYNDYSMAIPEKRNGVVRMIKKLQEQGIKIDGIGMQGHIDMNEPSIENFEKSILAFSGLGVKVMITELDLSVLPSPWANVGANISDAVSYQEKMNPYPDRLPEETEVKWEKRYLDFFKLFLKHRDKISRVTLWGVSDAGSWKNDFPIRGRTDYPLLFDRNCQAKPVIRKIIELNFYETVKISNSK
ncbi:MAG: endo-1,4-beta-xylanase [Tannerella sp.]|jgi:endo-1,4-beta-xylanase|nr:endo-1,4-beta-xylanase [Tannerella sp.]